MFKRIALGSVAALALGTAPALADIDVKLGVLNDRSGIYADIAGEGSVVAARISMRQPKASTSRSSLPTTRTDPTWLRRLRVNGMIRTMSMSFSTFRHLLRPSQCRASPQR